MRFWKILAVLIAALLGLCSCGVVTDLYSRDDEDPMDRREKPDDSVTPSEIRSRIIHDAMLRRLLDNVDLGKSACDDLAWEEGHSYCGKHDIETFEIDFPYEYETGRKAVRERAYYCSEHGMYWYRWKKLEPEETRWLGPYPIKMRKVE